MAKQKERGGKKKKKKMEEIDTYVCTYRNKVEHSCSSIGEKEGR
jgi:hypothetical protein